MWVGLIIGLNFKWDFIAECFRSVCHSTVSPCPTLRDYTVELQKCPPRVEIACLAVREKISFNFQLLFAADGHFINYCFLASSYRAV